MYFGQIDQTLSSVQCKCPNHVADPLMRLNAFERYSMACKKTTVTDASAHAMLYLASGQYREILEEALRRNNKKSPQAEACGLGFRRPVRAAKNDQVLRPKAAAPSR